MRAALAALLLCATLSSAAPESWVTLMDWTPGSTLLGSRVPVDGVTAVTFPLALGQCHRNVLVDLLYGPHEAKARVDGVGEVVVPFEFRADLRSPTNATLTTATIRQPGYGTPLGTAPSAGAHSVRLALAQGAAVDWQLRLRGHATFGEVACLPAVRVNEVEANPAGPDAGNEWIELHNGDSDAVDLSGWTLMATHGQPASLTLPPGTMLASGGVLRVLLVGGQFLDNADEVVELHDEFGALRDATPVLTDAADDARTWQRVPDGGLDWAFAVGTPDAANAS